MVVGPSDGLNGCNENGIPPVPFNDDGYHAVGARGHRLDDVPLLLLVLPWCGDDKCDEFEWWWWPLSKRNLSYTKSLPINVGDADVRSLGDCCAWWCCWWWWCKEVLPDCWLVGCWCCSFCAAKFRSTRLIEDTWKYRSICYWIELFIHSWIVFFAHTPMKKLANLWNKRRLSRLSQCPHSEEQHCMHLYARNVLEQVQIQCNTRNYKHIWIPLSRC